MSNTSNILDTISGVAFDARYKFVRRDFGGYFVEILGLRIGWAVKISGAWEAFTYDTSRPSAPVGIFATRGDAASEIGWTVSNGAGRLRFEQYLGKVEADERRIAELLAS